MNIIERIWFKWALLLLIVTPSLIYMGTRITREESWDNWDFGSAQTILTVRYWARDGFIAHKFLFIPSGYHRDIHILDQPEFRFLADGLKTGELIGTRLYYTHYPSGYLVPHGILAALGVESRVWFRALALLLSYGSVMWLAGFIYLISGRRWWVMALAVLYYTTSTTFLGYADSLANMPIDDFLKYAILFFSVYVIEKTQSPHIEGKWKKIIWSLYFLLSISSYDSTLFIGAWLCAWDWWRHRSFRWKEYFVWATAPLLAFIMQILQNVWYLGWRDMLLDFWGALAFRAGQAPAVLEGLPAGIRNVVAALSTIGYATDIRTRFILPLLAVILFLVVVWKIFDRRILTLLGILLVGGLCYAFVLPVAGTFGYQGRQVMPAMLLLIALLTTALMSSALTMRKRAIIAVCVLTLWTMHFQGAIRYAQQWPNNAIEKEKIEYWKKISTITNPETIIIGTRASVESATSRFFQQVYIDRLVLPFDKPRDIAEHFFELAKAAPDAHFLMISAIQEYDDVIRALNDRGIPYHMKIVAPLKEGYIFFTIEPILPHGK